MPLVCPTCGAYALPECVIFDKDLLWGRCEQFYNSWLLLLRKMEAHLLPIHLFQLHVKKLRIGLYNGQRRPQLVTCHADEVIFALRDSMDIAQTA